MKLGLFNRWKPLGTMYGLELEYQTSPVKGGGNVFATYIKDKKSGATVTRSYGRDKDAALQNTLALLKRIGPEAIHQAVESGQPVLVAPKEEEKQNIDWRDGANHSYRAQRKIVGEAEEKPVIRNFVAKHARSVNKAGPMRDKKNDYKRKAKHKKKLAKGDE